MRATIEHDITNPIIASLGGATIDVEVDEDTMTTAGTVMLASHVTGLPLAPGDFVRLNGAREIVEVVKPLPVWIFDVVCSQPRVLVAPGAGDPSNWSPEGLDGREWDLAELAADAVEQDLARRAVVHRNSAFSITVATDSRVWFDAWLEAANVWYYQVLRQPGDTVDLRAELKGFGLIDRPMFGLT